MNVYIYIYIYINIYIYIYIYIYIVYIYIYINIYFFKQTMAKTNFQVLAINFLAESSKSEQICGGKGHFKVGTKSAQSRHKVGTKL